MKNHKNIGFLRNTGSDPLKNHKVAKPAFKKWAIIGMSAKRHLNDAPKLVVFGFTHQLKKRCQS